MATEGDLAQGASTRRRCSTDVTAEMRVAQEEIFGPVLSIIEVETLEEAIAVNNDTRYGLSSSIFTRDINAAQVAMRDLTTGIVYINAGTIGAEIQLALRRHARHRQRPPRGGPGRAGVLHRVEGDLRRLQRQAPARADRRIGASQGGGVTSLADTAMWASVCRSTCAFAWDRV